MDFATPYQRGNRDGFSGRRPQKQRMCDGFEYWRGYQDGKRERATLAASIAKAFACGRIRIGQRSV